MRLLADIPCGCDSRDEIIFRAGHLSWIEGAILATAAVTLLLAFTANRGTHA